MTTKGWINSVAWFLAIGLIALLTGALTIASFNYLRLKKQVDRSGYADVIAKQPNTLTTPYGSETGTDGEAATFTSADEFLAYINSAPDSYSYGVPSFRSGFFEETFAEADLSFDAFDSASVGEVTSASAEPIVSRTSQTNVQVAEIDEPDLVKTDGDNLYISQLPPGRNDKPKRDVVDDVYYDYYYPSFEATKSVQALPLDDLAVLGEIDTSGDLLLHGDTLMVVAYDAVTAYDVSNPAQPEQLWELDYGYDTNQHTARLYNGQLYVVTYNYLDYTTPCPYVALDGATTVEVACSDIWYPTQPTPTDVTYTVMRVDVDSGQVDDTVAFVGSAQHSTVYMSGDHIYVTNVIPPDPVEVMYDFFTTDGRKLITDTGLARLEQIRSYDISAQSKQTELSLVLADLRPSYEDTDAMIEFDNNLHNAQELYYETHQRQMESTGIMKVQATGDMDLVASGTVPGVPLNQFSLDEYNDHLRITTTVGEPTWNNYLYEFGSQEETVNDLYVLNEDLEIVGEVLDMGQGERIYSTRLMGDVGYMVTFRQIDPFYVLDLSDPTSPEQVGELKIPGYSSYLHPLAEGLILGVGEEDNRVKVSLFDVSDPTTPLEISKYQLEEYWSEATTNHRAFLQDAEHEVFFIPGSQAGYIFSYTDNELNLEKAVADVSARRAVYINDYMYIVGRTELVVLDETTWERVAELDLTQ